jgi:hypothetical protein
VMYAPLQPRTSSAYDAPPPQTAARLGVDCCDLGYPAIVLPDPSATATVKIRWRTLGARRDAVHRTTAVSPLPALALSPSSKLLRQRHAGEPVGRPVRLRRDRLVRRPPPPPHAARLSGTGDDHGATDYWILTYSPVPPGVYRKSWQPTTSDHDRFRRQTQTAWFRSYFSADFSNFLGSFRVTQ